jgi:hypothetical protein
MLDKKAFTEDIVNLSQRRENIDYDFKNAMPLQEVSDITCGLEYGALRNLFIADTRLNTKYHRVINGADGVPERYSLIWNGEYVLFDKEYERRLMTEKKNISKTGKYVHLISGDENKYNLPKLFIRQSAKKIIATYDDKNYYALRSLFVLNSKSVEYSIKYLLAVLNSKLITHYSLSKGIIRYAKGKQPQIRVKELNKLPIKQTSNQQPFIHLCDYMLFLNETEERRKTEKDLIEFIDTQVIDSLVYELYFREKFEEDGLETNLIGLVEPYLEDIEDLKSDEEKLEGIKEVIEGIKSDSRIMKEIGVIKSHEWVKTIEGAEEVEEKKF